jgi:hypothetical protein
MLSAGMNDTFRVVHASVQGNHIHLLVEATSADAISKGVQHLEIALARAINKSLKRTGKVFEFRYHRVDITTPRQTRCALAYVLNNWRRHREDVTTPGAENALVDPYSTAWAFDGWRDLDEIPDWDRIPSANATTWLLRVGWRRHGTISVREVPGPLHESRVAPSVPDRDRERLRSSSISRHALRVAPLLCCHNHSRVPQYAASRAHRSSALIAR